MRRRSASITLGRRMWSISVGSGGTGPLVITHRPGPGGLELGLAAEREHRRQARAVVEAEDLVLARAAQVGVEHDRRDADAAERDGEVGDDRRLALRRLGARDLDHAVGRLVHQELDVGAQRAVALLQVVRALLVPDQGGACRATARAGGRAGRAPARSCAAATSAAVSIRRRNCSSASASSMPPNRPSSAGDAEQQRRARLHRRVVGRRRVDERGDHQLVAGDRLRERLRGRRRGGGGRPRGRSSRAVMRRMPVPPSVEVSMSAVSLWPSARWARARLTRRLRGLGVGAQQRRQAVGGDEPLALLHVGRQRERRRSTRTRSGARGSRARC